MLQVVVSKFASNLFTASDSEIPGYLGDLWKFNLSHSAWSSVESHGSSPWRRYGHSLVAIGGNLYIFGGDSDLGYCNIFYEKTLMTLTSRSFFPQLLWMICLRLDFSTTCGFLIPRYWHGQSCVTKCTAHLQGIYTAPTCRMAAFTSTEVTTHSRVSYKMTSMSAVAATRS